MSMGIDVSGRALRWGKAEPNVVQRAYAVQGCPPYDRDEQIIWNYPDALRSQVHKLTLSLDMAWNHLLKGDQQVTWEYADGTEGGISPAKAIAQAVKAHCSVEECGSGLALTIPNLLDEDGQDELLIELTSAGFSSPLLLWRPVAVALNWLNPSGSAKPDFSAGSRIWVLDFDSTGLEITELGSRIHTKDPTWVSPVRHYPLKDGQTTLIERCQILRIAWDELFADIVDRNQLKIGLLAPGVQEQIENHACIDITAWTCLNSRWQRCEARKDIAPSGTIKSFERILNAATAEHTAKPKTGDVVLLHGWLARLWPEAMRRMVGVVWQDVRVEVTNADAVVSGAKIYAERRAKNLPTYYDTVPEYKIWCSIAGVTGWKTVVEKKDNIEPGEPWHLRDEVLQNSFGIPRYRDRLSLLVQRQPVIKRDTDMARRLCAGLSSMTQSDVALLLDATISAAQGNAKFVVSIKDQDNKNLFMDERSKMELSYGRSTDLESKLGKETVLEPEHKGHLEAQPVVGRIHDSPDNVQLLKCIVNWLANPFEHPRPIVELANYRIGHTIAYVTNLADDAFVQLAIDRWGYTAIPKTRQPTRGLFGTRRINNIKVSELANEFVCFLWGNGPVLAGPLLLRNRWHKRLNWCHIYAGSRYAEYIRSQIRMGTMGDNWSQAFAPGYVLGEDKEDAKLLAGFNIDHGFGTGQFPEIYWWAFFRMLCWHEKVYLEKEFVEQYLGALCDHIDNVPVPMTTQAKKNALFAILFALRVRAVDKDALCSGSKLIGKLCTVINDHLNLVLFPPSMIGNMAGLGLAGDNLSQYVLRFLRKEDSLSDRELGAGIALMD